MKLKIKGLIYLSLLIVWTISALSGLILYFAPDGQRSGQKLLLWNLSKHQWSGIHAKISFLALAITLIHIFLDWKIFIVVIKNLWKTK